jgi:hypothetical protein
LLSPTQLRTCRGKRFADHCGEENEDNEVVEFQRSSESERPKLASVKALEDVE